MIFVFNCFLNLIISIEKFYFINFVYTSDTDVDKTNPCSSTECGPNSKCRVVNEIAVCTCLPTYVGRPPMCRPECVSNSDCPATQSCVKQKCTDLCPTSCGLYTNCRVINHAALCNCAMGYTGDPFTVCFPIPCE